MSRNFAFGLVLLGTVSATGALGADCTSTSNADYLNQSQMGTLLNGNTACVGSGPTWQNQELHSSGNIIDFKRGPGHPVDPSKTIGTYAISNDSGKGVVTYSYTGGGAFAFKILSSGAAPGSTVTYCQGSSPLSVFIKPGGGGC